MTTKVTNFDSAQEALAASLPGYERRAPQALLAHNIESHLSGEALHRHLLGEAGTGTGKSLGYLIPAICSGKRVIVATATKALQSQIAFKDLPFLAEHLGRPFTYAVLKGKSNYACHVAVEKTALDDPPLARRVYDVFNSREAEADFLAERDDFEDMSDRDWISLVTSQDDCPGKSKCPFGEKCFSEKAKANARSADIVVVNHALLLTDLRIRKATGGHISILGDYDAIIWDEAHEIEEYTTSTFQVDLRERKITLLTGDLRNFCERAGGQENATAARIIDILPSATSAAQQLFERLPVGRLMQTDILGMGDYIVAVYEHLVDVRNLLEEISLEDAPANERKSMEGGLRKLQRRTDNIIEAVSGLILGDFDSEVRWVDVETPKTGRNRTAVKTLHSAPVNVAPILRNGFFAENRPCFKCGGEGEECERCGGRGYEYPTTNILVSATLTVNRQFAYVAGRLGIDSYDGLNVGTPFDYSTQGMLYIPTHLPDPNQKNMVAWSSMALNEIKQLVLASDGRALLLFTASKQMRNAYDLLKGELPFTCLVQGDGSNKELASKFMSDSSSVLFATRSFFTGVDFQGEACSLVVIDKLVFDVPTDPIFQARCEAVERAGGKPFLDYSVPKMVLTLQQGAGRLIRHRNDKGVVAILDPRLKSKGYGKTILNSLPDFPVVTDFGSVSNFFEKAKVSA